MRGGEENIGGRGAGEAFGRKALVELFLPRAAEEAPWQGHGIGPFGEGRDQIGEAGERDVENRIFIGVEKDHPVVAIDQHMIHAHGQKMRDPFGRIGAFVAHTGDGEDLRHGLPVSA